MKGKPVIPPVHLTATYKFDNTDDLIDVVQNRSGYIYSRWDNPSVVEAENTLAAMEGYDRALGFGSGMAAITTAIMAHVKSDSRVISTREIYGGTFELLNGDFDITKQFMDELKLIKLATSLGGVSSLANQPITNTHAALSPENRAKAGISGSLVRLSVGIENVDLIIQDLGQALEKI